MQLDIFENNREVMLRNDVMLALERHDAAASRVALELLSAELPGDSNLPALSVLNSALTIVSADLFTDHESLRAARLALVDIVKPTALSTFGPAQARTWLPPLWRQLARQAGRLSFVASRADDHAAPCALRAGDWQCAADSVETIESWRRVPAPLSWMVEARLHLAGFMPTLHLLTELAWLSPRRLREVVGKSNDPLLTGPCKRFDASFEAPDDDTALAWFPAWLLIEQPQTMAQIARAQSSQHSPAEQATRLIVELMGLEAQGRQRDLTARRQVLRDLQPELFATYMKTR